MEGNSDDESEDESDGKSVDGGSEVGCNMEDEVEDGEIRSPILKSPIPEVEIRPISESPPVQVNDRSPENEPLGTEGLHELHGNPTIHKVVINDPVIPEKKAARVIDGGPQQKSTYVSGLVDQIVDDGPTPMVGLGKRNRAYRSPPSTGSMQGPPVRGFFHEPASDEQLFDLNRPTLENGSVGGEPVGGPISAQSPVISGPAGRLARGPSYSKGWC
ncbi:hypothetical protein Hanom_Chr04g00362471 [Helianthus anomalus]